MFLINKYKTKRRDWEETLEELSFLEALIQISLVAFGWVEMGMDERESIPRLENK